MTEESGPGNADPTNGDHRDPTTSGERQARDAGYFPGEHGRSVPRSAWIILGIAIVILLVFVIARPTWFTEDADDKSLDVPADHHYSKSLSGAGYSDGVWLTDDSPSTTFSVTFPADSPRDQTRLWMRGTTQVAQDSVVFLTVRMDGQQVYKAELQRGDNPLDTVVEVPDGIAADGQVRVQVQVQGTLDDQVCTPDHSAGMQVHLDPTTVLEAALSEPIHTVRDAVTSWDRDLTVVVGSTDDQWRTTAAQLGIALTRIGHRVTFVDTLGDASADNAIFLGPPQEVTELGWTEPDDSGEESLQLGSVNGTPVVAVLRPDGDNLSRFLTEPPVTTADARGNTPAVVTASTPGGGEVSLGALGADTSVTQIAEDHSWRARYSLADLPGGRLPQSVRVALTLPASPDDLTWILNTRLNDRLVDSRRLDPSAPPPVIALPASAQLLDNTLTLSVQRDRDLGGCDVRVTSYPIQLNENAALALGDTPGAGFTGVPRALSRGFDVYSPNSTGDNAIAQLNATVPLLADFTPAGYVPEFRWGAAPRPREPFILIGSTPDVNPLVRIVDGRLVAGAETSATDLTVPDTGIVVQTATTATGNSGLMIQYTGDPGTLTLPDFGQESAQVVTAQGSLVIDDEGRTPPTEPTRALPPP
ncbi:hypothetical protein M1C59_14380 [Gordonia terrae]|uniref:hypothetical protein n=1 Tax=Gordonia terrae TaxID=2055 RepID=UPI00200ABE5D|nr:hypothetical protein [Gordonia terrae]UPW07273.1 hypothetical protein M1C59_14380 [Gordonia terrae]